MSSVKKAVKTTLKIGVGVGAAILGAGAAVYECALNTKLNAKVIGYFDNPDPEQDALYKGDAYNGNLSWFDEHKGEDHVITTEKTGNTHAYIIPAENPGHKWAVCCHGYNSAPSGTSPFTQHFHEAGYNCVVPSMRGWGNDEEAYCSMGYKDKDICMAWINYVVEQDPEATIVLHGYSMGAATVMLATGEELPANVKAAVCDCGFTSCEEQFQHVIKSFTGLPPFPLLNTINLISVMRKNFDIRQNNPIDAVRRSVTPTVFLHGTADDFVPYYMMDQLYDACAAEPKAKQPIEGGQHATAVLKNPELYWQTVDAFLADLI